MLIDGTALAREFIASCISGRRSVLGDESPASSVIARIDGPLQLSQLPDALRTKLRANGFLNVKPLIGGDRHALFNGDAAKHENDHSRADAALVAHFRNAGLSPEEADRAMRASGLYRDKWDSMRGETTYGQLTIARVYAARPAQLIEADAACDGAILPISEGRISVLRTPPPPRQWALDGLLPLGCMAVLAGVGGASKTMLAIIWAIHVLLGKLWAGYKAAKGGAMLVLGEEDQREALARVGGVCALMQLTDAELAQVERNLLVFAWAGRPMKLTMLRDGNPSPTAMVDAIIDAAREINAKLVVLDHARLLIGGDPNDAQHVTEVTRQVTRIANETGAAVLVLGHSPKSSISRAKNGEASDQSDIAGSSAWVDNARVAMVLRTMTAAEAKQFCVADRERYAALRLVKSNYSRTGGEVWLERRVIEAWGCAVPTAVTMTEPTAHVATDSGVESRLVGLIVEQPGRHTRRSLIRAYAGRRGPLKASERDIENALASLLASGRLLLRAPTADERKAFDLSKQVAHVLDVIPSSEGNGIIKNSACHS